MNIQYTHMILLNIQYHMKWRNAIEEYLSIYSPIKKHNTHFHIAFLFLRGKVVAVATNQIGSRSRGVGYSTCTIHAERAVIKELGDISKLRGTMLVVIRLGSSGDFLKSNPCKECQYFLKKCVDVYGLASIHYS